MSRSSERSEMREDSASESRDAGLHLGRVDVTRRGNHDEPVQAEIAERLYSLEQHLGGTAEREPGEEFIR